MTMDRFDEDGSYPVTRFVSRGISIGRGGRVAGDVQTLASMSAGAACSANRKRSGHTQLFSCVSGEGWGRGASDSRIAIRSRRAVGWIPGECQEPGSEGGMMTIIVEGQHLDPSKFMPELLDGMDS
ncbi:MAG: hypothetical protein R3A46_09230 [Thermomicrobiales bacterium]